MRIFLFIFIISLLFFSCSSKDKLPEGTLTINQMKPIMWDLMKAGELAANDTIKQKNISFKDSAELLFDKIFALHHVNKNTFYSSYQYYLQQPEKLTILMDSITSFANRERYMQALKRPQIPGNQNPQYNKTTPQNILREKMFNKKMKKDSVSKKIKLS